MTDKLVVVLTAFNLEYRALRAHLSNLQLHRHERGTRFEVGTIAGRRCRIALALTDKGNQPAAVLAERAIAEFAPTAVLFVGVAGALWDSTALGDVVVATHVYAYHGGTSEDDGLKARPRAWEASHSITQLASHLSRTNDWTEYLPTAHRTNTSAPQVHFGAIAAGEIVHNSRISDEARWIRTHYNDALAIEMEAAGVAQAGHLNGSPVAIIRGISDRADGSKASGPDRIWQPRAAAAAAAFAVRLAEELITEEEHSAMQEFPNRRPGTSVNNYATGPVGIQTAHVSGSTVWMSTAPSVSGAPDLAAALRDLGGDLARQHSSGSLDADTYRAAQAELDIASAALPADNPEGKSRVVLALKRLRGLIADTAELALKVTALITAASGLL
ncbi:nucleoside phosphorylase [Crossiella equi]|uniref:Nucleoside phosphorylase n=1 Tax=Crossiella equi TaxID=130796 RepID=A0ABS5AMT9_9PSEU|nr:5'-methylthioadenosine/S-adenosylhomocysteine nucleosidase [Crossiella equi]MBP2477557.1 nucleoside phosphorylase [Crossiella equi]